MRRHFRSLLPVLGALLLLLSAMPAFAHDDEDHSGPGSTGPDQHSQNVKLLANVAKSSGATQSDLAFAGRYAYAGNYGGFRIIDVSNPEVPVVVSDFSCNGAQGDVSIYGNLLFQSVDRAQSSPACDSTNVTASTEGMFEGIRIFDVSNPNAPRHINSVPTDCGSHTHTLVPDAANSRVLVYVSSYPLGAASVGPNCQQPHGFISIVNVPLSNPTAATVSKYHLDVGTEMAVYLGGAFSFKACHDISVFTGIKRAAAACMSESQLWDISDPLNPKFLWRFDDPAIKTENIDLWHSATFSWDGKVVAFGDESGGGGAARCTDPNDDQGRVWFVDAETGTFLGNYKIPRAESGTCTTHNFNFIPLPKGRKVLVASSYTAGTTVVDVNDPTRPKEIGFYKPSGSNTWSSYWYNGFIYANDINRGVDILLLSDSLRAAAKRLPYMNPQSQESVIR
jgi:hypothetical protein